MPTKSKVVGKFKSVKFATETISRSSTFMKGKSEHRQDVPNAKAGKRVGLGLSSRSRSTRLHPRQRLIEHVCNLASIRELTLCWQSREATNELEGIEAVHSSYPKYHYHIKAHKKLQAGSPSLLIPNTLMVNKEEVRSACIVSTKLF